MRLATYNVEWFNALFDEAGAPLADNEWSARWNVTRAAQLEALGIVFTALDADAVLIVEAPDWKAPRRTETALEGFAALFGLRARKALIGFPNDTQQELALLYDPDRVEARHVPVGEATGKKGSEEAPRFDGVFRIDLDIDAREDLVRFSKPPLEAELRLKGFDEVVRLIGVHIKSKAPHGARSAADATRISIANRRKQLAQSIWLRRRVEQHLAAGEALVVAGDFNDGPGLDEYEALFGRSGMEIVLGADQPEAMRLVDPHARQALAGGLMQAKDTTARFYLREEKRYLSALLDYLMLSPGLAAHAQDWRIWHPFDDSQIYALPELREALLTASDHFPVSVDLDPNL
ncbi:endonuclease [Vannielia litorea]|uniref:endonuclease/exonuclease/phosphatase family protein n=1 Tax=Vannielia litorea TaxID=1217970 RepID=UPI001C95FEDB|nr:endonuclease/exonuclease/phosphatase family protein [Vannielia litorea]MBY6152001.1 endonuclease [Vannielia litorea]